MEFVERAIWDTCADRAAPSADDGASSDYPTIHDCFARRMTSLLNKATHDGRRAGARVLEACYFLVDPFCPI